MANSTVYLATLKVIHSWLSKVLISHLWNLLLKSGLRLIIINSVTILNNLFSHWYLIHMIIYILVWYSTKYGACCCWEIWCLPPTKRVLGLDPVEDKLFRTIFQKKPDNSVLPGNTEVVAQMPCILRPRLKMTSSVNSEGLSAGLPDTNCELKPTNTRKKAGQSQT